MASLLHIFPSFSLGGSQARLLELISADPTAHVHRIVSLNGDLSALERIASIGTVEAIDGRVFMGQRWPWLKIRRWLSLNKPDRLLTYNWGACDWAIAALGMGIPHVAVEDGFGPEESVRRLLRRNWIRYLVFGWGGSRMVVPSRTLETIALSEWKIPAHRLSVIPNGVDARRFLPSSHSSKAETDRSAKRPWIIGTLAGLRPEKRLDRLLDAVAEVAKNHPVRLMIGGTGPLESSLRQHCHRHGLQNCVEFVGFVRDTPAFLAELDIFVLSSDTEQLPISMIEAMLVGLPVIATDVGDIRKSLPPVQADGVVSRSVTDLSRGITSLIKNPQQIRLWGQTNRDFATQRFSLHVMVDGWRNIYDGREISWPSSFKAEDKKKASASRDLISLSQSSLPRIIVFSSLFPSSAAPEAGVFIRERMFRVAQRVPLVVVSPQPWSPLDALVRCLRPNFRPSGNFYEVMDGVRIFRPRYFSLPALFKGLDGWMMAVCSQGVVRRLVDEFKPTVIDAHFVYPDGFAATKLARRHGLACSITLRGSKDTSLIGTSREPAMREALKVTDLIISVSDSLKHDVGLKLGISEEKIQVVRNGVDLARFFPVNRVEARNKFGLHLRDKVIVSAGRLVEGKGFHRLIPLLKRLRGLYPNIKLLIAGTGTGSEDMEESLRLLTAQLGLVENVRFCGALSHDEMRYFYSAGDVFCLATRYEGWANVFLEAMACGLPVVTTNVGGNSQVVRHREVGTLVPFWDVDAFSAALTDALGKHWDQEFIRAYAMQHEWDQPVEELISAISRLGAS